MSEPTEAEQLRAARKAVRDAEWAKRDLEAAESRRVDEQIDQAAAIAVEVLPTGVGAALAALLDATKPWRASDGHLSSSAITRHSPEVLALAEALLATAQPAPSVPAGADVAAVLAELLELRRGIELWGSVPPDGDWCDRFDALCTRAAAAQQLAATGASLAEPHGPRCAHARMFCAWLVSLDDPEDVLAREERRSVAVTQIIERARHITSSEPVAPPTPAAHGVAELLAMCAERQKRPMRVDRRMSCDEIVRYLAPEGGQS